MIGEEIFKLRSKTSNKLTDINLNLLIIVSILFALSIPRTVNAAVFNISSGNVNALINAINQANNNGEDDTIKLKAGTYTLTSVDNDTDGDNGLPSITSKITVKGAGADTAIIERDANADPFRIFHVASTGILTLDSLSIIGGFAEFMNFEFESSGGGILNNGGTVNVTSSTIADNTVDFGDGGGISNLGGTVIITDSTVFGNGVLGFVLGGGGIFNFNGTVNINRSTISGNFVEASNGGGISNWFGTVEITNSFIADNFAEVGGGIDNGGTMIITNSTLSSNSAFSGGGIVTDGTVTIINSAITNNNAFLADGGGIRNQGMVDVINSTITNNFVEFGSGGGIVNFFDGTVKITNSTVVNNTVIEFGDGGGIFNDTEGMVELQNTILALNTLEFDTTSNASDCSGKITSLANNLVGDTTDCTITLQTTDLTGDPGLGDFTDDGTPGNGHFPLLPDSQAIDAGNNDVCLDNPILATDQIGNPRFGICDIGSIEFQPPFKNLGQCISTLIKQNCSGLKGKDRAACNPQQQQFCKGLFKGNKQKKRHSR
jgi:hypothetical protein